MREMVFATVVKGGLYVRHWKVLMRSMLENNRGLSAPFVVIHDGLADSQKQEMRNEYRGVEFYQADPSRYIDRYREKDERTINARTNPGYLSFEIANPKMDAEKVVFLDADLMCDGKIDALLRYEGNVCMTREPTAPQWWAGIIVATPSKYLYDWLMKQPHSVRYNDGWGTDQNVWNQWPTITRIANPDCSVACWSTKNYRAPARPMFWHFKAKLGQSAKDAPPDCGGWENTHDRARRLFDLYDSWEPLYPGRPVFVFSAGRNCGKLAATNIRALQSQGEDFRHVVVDDASTDDTATQIASVADDRTRFIHHGRRHYGPYSAWEASHAFEGIENDDILLQVDLDDSLLPGALLHLRLCYRGKPNIWMTYGGLVDQKGKTHGPESLDRLNSVRREPLFMTGLRSFRSGLYRQIPQNAVKRNGHWPRCKFDVAIYCPMAELAGRDRIQAIHQLCFLHQFETGHQVNHELPKDELEKTREEIIASPRRQTIASYQ